MNMSLLINQHASIREQVGELEKGIRSNNIAEEAFDLSMKISKLSGTLVLHLKSEDDYLYPTLMKSTIESTKKTAEFLNRQMGSLASEFMDYKSTYMIAKNIKADPLKFVTNTKAIIAALKKRLDAEEAKLYPLA